MIIRANNRRIAVSSSHFDTLQALDVVDTNEWVHIAVRVNRNDAQLWINATIDAKSSRWIPESIRRLQVGTGGPRTDGAALYLVDELRLSDVYRTPTEIGDAAFVNLRPTPAGVNELDLDVYLPGAARAWTAETRQQITTLGKKLFFSKSLSADNKISCASCHNPSRAFSDRRRTSTGAFKRQGKRNAAITFNRDSATRQFLDGRAATLESQVAHPFRSQNEFGLNMNRPIDKIASQFAPSSSRLCATHQRRRLALAPRPFQRSLISAESGLIIR